MATSRGTIDEGKLAALLGRLLSENPYPESSDDHREWAEGHAAITESSEHWTRREEPKAKQQNPLDGAAIQ